MAAIKTATLNQVLDLFNQFVDDHPMLRDYGYGPTSEIGNTNQMDFPYMWVSQQSDSSIRISNKTQTPELSFYVLFMDQVTDNLQSNDENGSNSTNEQEVLSDTLQYLQDLIKTVNQSWNGSGLQITEDVRCFAAQDETNDKVAGWVGEVTLRLTYANANCFISPAVDADCNPGTLKLNGVIFTSIPSGNTKDVEVLNTDTTPVGTAVGEDFIIGDTSITVNSSPFTSSAAEGNYDIQVKDTEGTNVGSKVGDEWIVPAYTPCVVNTTLMKTGQTTSYRTGDDGDYEAGRADDFFTLPSDNIFGNTYRFTDELGGQTFTNNVIIDWSTYNGVDEVLGWYNVFQVDGNWNDSIDAAILKSLGGFTSGWRMPNRNELNSIVNCNVTPVLNYSPFNQNVNLNVYMSTTVPNSTTKSYYMTLSVGSVNGFTKTSNFGGRQLVCRTFTITGGTLT